MWQGCSAVMLLCSLEQRLGKKDDERGHFCPPSHLTFLSICWEDLFSVLFFGATPSDACGLLLALCSRIASSGIHMKCWESS